MDFFFAASILIFYKVINMAFERFWFPRETRRGYATPKSNAFTEFLSDDRLANFLNNVYNNI
jgi:hypothetical protein